MIVALLAVFALAVAACGAPAAPAEGGEVIKVGTNAEYQPFEFVDENGEIVGFDVDIVNEIAERAGFEVEWVNTRWDGIFVALANGEFNLVASAVTITDERKQTIDFSEPYFNAGQSIAVRADNADITGPDSLTEGVRVGVQLGTTGDIWLTENTQADVQRFEDNPLAVQALAAGDLEAVVADAPTLADIIRANPELNLKMVGEPFTEEFYGIGIRKGQDELKAQIDAALAAMREDGTYDEIYNKWFGAEQ
jgi:polar amino acid transport system substrate-binding protein